MYIYKPCLLSNNCGVSKKYFWYNSLRCKNVSQEQEDSEIILGLTGHQTLILVHFSLLCLLPADLTHYPTRNK